MTRILLDGTPLDTSHRHRGVGRYASCLIAAMQSEAHARAVPLDVLRLARSDASDPGPRFARPCPATGRDWLKAAASFGRIESTIASVGATSWLGLDPDVVARPARRIRAVATVYDIIPLLHPDEYLPWSSLFGLPRLLHAAWNPRRLRQADHLVAISHEVKRTLVERLRLSPERIAVIQPGADHLALAPEGPRQFPPSGRPFVLHVGAVDARKNLPRTLRALSLLPRSSDLVLAVAGRMTEAEESGLRAAAREAGVEHRLEPLGFVDDARLASLYRAATAFVFPSLAEGWGLPVLEAMAHGCPVVTSNRSSLPEAAGDAALLVDPTSPESIALAVARLEDDSTLRADLVARGLRRVGDFTWSASARAHMNLLLA